VQTYSFPAVKWSCLSRKRSLKKAESVVAFNVGLHDKLRQCSYFYLTSSDAISAVPISFSFSTPRDRDFLLMAGGLQVHMLFRV